jgi:hypothetical protein
MVTNEGTTDRVIRVVVGLILGYLAYRGLGGTVGTWILAIVGAVLFLTGISGFCLVYRLLGIQTCPVRTQT